MRRTAMNSILAAIAGLALSGAAHAAYRCDSPASRVDRVACEMAEQGPDALRRFIERMRPAHSLHFYDYVSDARLLAWQNAMKRERAARPLVGESSVLRPAGFE